jgi:hypothetical protein
VLPQVVVRRDGEDLVRPGGAGGQDRAGEGGVVKTLRRKLGIAGLVEAVRGVGYRLRTDS